MKSSDKPGVLNIVRQYYPSSYNVSFSLLKMKPTARKSTTSWTNGCNNQPRGLAMQMDDTGWGYTCRACLKSQSPHTLLNLFLYWTPPWKCARTNEDQIAKQISRFTGTQIEQFDGYPQYICNICFDKFKDAFSFYYSVRHHDNKMRSSQLLFEAPSVSSSQMETSCYGEDNNGKDNASIESIEVKQEVLSEEDAGENEFFEMMDESEIKIEPEEIMKPHYSLKVNGYKSPRSNIVISSCFSVDPNVAVESSGQFNRISTDFEEDAADEADTEADSDLPLDCMLCNKHLHSISGLRAHVINSHSYKTVTRKRSSSKSGINDRDRTTLENNQMHIKTEFTGDYQNGTTKTKTVRELKSEHLEESVNSEEKFKSLDIYSCATCEKKFSEKIYLKIHNEACHSLTDADSTSKNKFRDMIEEQIIKEEHNLLVSSDIKVIENENLVTTSDCRYLDEDVKRESITEDVNTLEKHIPLAKAAIGET